MYCGTFWWQEVLSKSLVRLMAGKGTVTGRHLLFEVVEIEDGRECIGKGRSLGRWRQDDIRSSLVSPSSQTSELQVLPEKLLRNKVADY